MEGLEGLGIEGVVLIIVAVIIAITITIVEEHLPLTQTITLKIQHYN